MGQLLYIWKPLGGSTTGFSFAFRRLAASPVAYVRAYQVPGTIK